MKKANDMYGPGDEKRVHTAADQKKSSDYRTNFRRDYARLIHSPAFRRLQGKTQLFPGTDSDFFRNRLTHSIEVAQIAKTIALKFNREQELESEKLDLDLMELAGLAHDLGHPPFGHNGEYALDACMKDLGGFEGNAQTLRILSRLEKKVRIPNAIKLDFDSDWRKGLNLCMRSLASILKYDKPIPQSRGASDPLAKGYYTCDAELVREIKSSVLDGYALDAREPFKTIECGIMDIADDIAYSTYDLEDSLKAAFVSPLDLLSPPREVVTVVAHEVTKTLRKVESPSASFTIGDVLNTLAGLVANISPEVKVDTGHVITREELLRRDRELISMSKELQKNGYARIGLTSELIDKFVSGISLDIHSGCRALSGVKVEPTVLRQIETLKHFNFAFTIMSPRVRLTAYRGHEIVTTVFNALMDDGHQGAELLPEDVHELWKAADDKKVKARVVCDFIAGMTDQYAVEFYARLQSETARSIFKPH